MYEKTKVATAVAAAIASMHVAHADSSKELNPSNGHTYQRFDTAATWDVAKGACEGLGGYLATITSQEESDWISDALLMEMDIIWLGATDEGHEGTWEWVTDETWDYTNWDLGPREPNGGTSENHLNIWGGIALLSSGYRVFGTWNDTTASGAYPYLCEWDSEEPLTYYTVKLKKTGNGTGTVRGGGEYTVGETVTLIAKPSAGSQFDSWSPNPCAATFTMPAGDLTCTAKFKRAEIFPPNGAFPTTWTTPADSDAPWTVSNDWKDEGSYSLRSGAISDDQTSQVQVSGNFKAGTASFKLKVSSETGYDGLVFYVDGAIKGMWSGPNLLKVKSIPLTAGAHTLTWVYTKDSATASGSDAAWIDSVVLPLQ